MRKLRPTDFVVPGLLTVIGVGLIVIWLSTGSRGDLRIRRPGMDQPPGGPQLQSGAEPVPIAGDPVGGPGVASNLSGTWPWFRGVQHDGICRDPTPLARQWPAAGPPRLWSIDLGEGYASAAIAAGRVYVLDYDDQAKADTLRCLSLDDGQEIWRNSYPILVARNHGMSRTVPAVIGDCVITLGPRCHVACWDAKTGKCRWLIDLVREYATTVPRWYAGQCPLIDGDRLILAPCGKAMVIAVDYRTGKVIWESPNPRHWQMTHASLMPMEYQGQRFYVCCGSGGVAGINAADGQLLWDTTAWPEQFATSPSPVVLPDGKIFLSSGYGNKVGALVLQLKKEGDRLTAENAFQLTPKQFNSEQQTPILYQQHLLGVRKRGGGHLVCLDLNGNTKWDSGADRFGHGPYMIADGLIFALDNHGKLAIAEARVDAYKPLAHCQVFPDGVDAWGPMAMAAGRLIVRDMTRMVCLDVAAASAEE